MIIVLSWVLVILVLLLFLGLRNVFFFIVIKQLFFTLIATIIVLINWLFVSLVVCIYILVIRLRYIFSFICVVLCLSNWVILLNLLLSWFRSIIDNILLLLFSTLIWIKLLFVTVIIKKISSRWPFHFCCVRFLSNFN